MNLLIRFRCECGKKLKASRDIIGKKVRCTNCVRTHRVPEHDHLPPKKTKPATKSSVATQSDATQSDAKRLTSRSSSAKQAPIEIGSPQQELVTSKPKTISPKSKKNSASKSPTSKPKPNVEPQKPNLIIPDELAANEPSLLPTNDDSGSRFKLDPKFDPEPSDAPLDPKSNFDFDFDATDGDETSTTAAAYTQRPSFQRPNSKLKLVIGLAAATMGVLLIATAWFVLNGSSYPLEFSNQPEVRNYVSKIQEFRKSHRTLKIVSEAYVKSKSPTAQEREQIEAFNRSIEPLANEQIKLNEALKLFQAAEYEKARSALITATQTLDEKIPELQSRAKDFSSKLR